jgi:hypothetical protein
MGGFVNLSFIANCFGKIMIVLRPLIRPTCLESAEVLADAIKLGAKVLHVGAHRRDARAHGGDGALAVRVGDEFERRRRAASGNDADQAVGVGLARRGGVGLAVL